MSSISLKNCELAQKFALYFYMLHNICSCCSIFNDRFACPRSRGQLIYYTTFFLVCQGVFRKFFDFFSKFFRMLLSAKLFMRFLGAFLKAPVYYTTNRPFCQGVFRKFFRFFVIFLRFSASYKAFRKFLSFFVHFIWKKRNSLPLRFHLLFDYLQNEEKEHAVTQSVPSAGFGKFGDRTPETRIARPFGYFFFSRRTEDPPSVRKAIVRLSINNGEIMTKSHNIRAFQDLN